MPAINFTNITDANSTLQIILALDNDVTGGWFSIMLLIALWIITFINMSTYDVQSSLMFSTVFTSIIAGLMLAAGMVDIFVFIFCVVVTVLASLGAILTRR